MSRRKLLLVPVALLLPVLAYLGGSVVGGPSEPRPRPPIVLRDPAPTPPATPTPGPVGGSPQTRGPGSPGSPGVEDVYPSPDGLDDPDGRADRDDDDREDGDQRDDDEGDDD